MPKRPLDKKNADQRRTATEQRHSAGAMQDSAASIRKSNARRRADFNQATQPRPRAWRVEDALNNDAGKRLQTLLGREATTTEIRQLRRGEQALGLEHPAYAKARQLVAEARSLRHTKDELLSEVRKRRGRAQRLRRVTAKNRKK